MWLVYHETIQELRCRHLKGGTRSPPKIHLISRIIPSKVKKMPDLRVPLVTREFYHVFNRGVARLPIFLSKWDYQQALLTLHYYSCSNPPMKLSRFKELSVTDRQTVLTTIQNSVKKVEIICYVLMPNHFHFLIKQIEDNGISSFISNFTNSYTRYFNTRHDRVGPLLQGVFKAVHVENDEQLIHLSRYIHLNPVTSFIIKDSEIFNYPWSSLPSFINSHTSFVSSTPILEHFPSIDSYKKFFARPRAICS